MSREEGAGSSKKAAQTTSKSTDTSDTSERQPQDESPPLHPTTPQKQPPDEPSAAKKPAAKRDQLSDSTTPSTPEDDRQSRPRQVIAVSASKGPAAFFNLSRKFLVTDDSCDLSALEGAIVTAVDAANLLERSQLAKIVRIQTSYVTVESRKKAAPSPESSAPSPLMSPSPPATQPEISPIPQSAEQQKQHHGSVRRGGTSRDNRRARIVITVQRTDAYRQWLEDNPLQAIIAGDGGDDELQQEESTTTAAPKGGANHPTKR